MNPDDYVNMSGEMVCDSSHTDTITINTGFTGPTGIYLPTTAGVTIVGSSSCPNTHTISIPSNYQIHPSPLQEQVTEIQKFVEELKSERELRKKYPALDHAYGQYEVMLELCKAKEADDAAGENSKGT